MNYETLASGHRVIEQSGLEGTLKDHLVHPFVAMVTYMRLFSTLPSHIFKTSISGDSTMFLGGVVAVSVYSAKKKKLLLHQDAALVECVLLKVNTQILLE